MQVVTISDCKVMLRRLLALGVLLSVLSLGLEAQAEAPAKGAPPPADDIIALQLGSWVRLMPSLQYRPRLLAHSGRDFADGKTYDAVSHRARLGLRADLGERTKIFFQLQDVRLWGEETNTFTDYSADGLDVHQAWAQLEIAKPLWLRVGRQELNLDGQRLVGAVAWADQARSFDGGVLGFDCKVHKISAKLFWFKLREKDAEGATTTSDFGGFWGRWSKWAPLRPSVYLLYDRDSASNRNRVTTGVYIDGKPFAGIDYRLEAYAQLGEVDDKDEGPASKIQAFFLGAEAGYLLPLPWKPRLRAFVDYVSGDNNKTNGTVSSFDTLFATNHKFYGFMDFFLNLPVQTAGRGLIDAGGRLLLSPWPKLLLRADVHAFMLARRLVEPTGDEQRYLGLEVDGTIAYKLNRFVSFELVGALFAPGRGMTCLKGGCRDDGKTDLFGYLQMDVKL